MMTADARNRFGQHPEHAPSRDEAAGRPETTLALLGPLVLSGPAGPIEATGKFAGILGVVACAHGQQKSREDIAGLFWSDKDEAQAKGSLRQIVLRMRQLPVADAFLITDQSIRLVRQNIGCDLWTFEHLVRDGSREALAEAMALYRGPLMSNVVIREALWEEWLQGERARWDQLAADSCVRLGELDLEAGNAGRAIEAARKALQIDGFREDAHRTLMRGLTARDRRSEALRHYDELAAFLERELDSEPDELTQALAVSLKQESAVTARTLPGARLDPHSALDLDRMVKQAIGMLGAGVLVIETSPATDAGWLGDFCLARAAPHGGMQLGQARYSPVFSFPDVKDAVAAGLEILRSIAESPDDACDAARLRLGIHVASAANGPGSVPDEKDIAIARQLCRLADAGQLVLSVEAREHVVEALDVELVDRGERSPPAAAQPLRSFTVSSPTQQPIVAAPPDMSRQLTPVIAVIPFNTLTNDPAHTFLGDIIADEMILALSPSVEVSVISRMSTMALRNRSLMPQDVHRLVNATYLASGNCHVAGGRVRLTIEFTDARSAQVIWVERFEADVQEVLLPGGIVEDFALKVMATIMLTELSRSREAPLKSLSDCTLLLGAIATMHQLAPAQFEASRAMLDALIERAPRHATPRAWLGMFLLLRVSQGWSADIEADAQLASDCTRRALDLEPGNSLALCVDAHVHTQFKKDFGGATRLLELALASNPSNSLAWLFKSTMHAFQGQGPDAISSADSAMRLSPLDPRRWFYDSLAATGALGAGEYERAIMLARRSIQSNATHASSFRALAIAQILSGRTEEARQTVVSLMKLQPDLTTTAYRRRHPSGASALGGLWADALRRAGVPD